MPLISPSDTPADAVPNALVWELVLAVEGAEAVMASGTDAVTSTLPASMLLGLGLKDVCVCLEKALVDVYTITFLADATPPLATSSEPSVYSEPMEGGAGLVRPHSPR